MFDLKVVKIDPKIIISINWSKSVIRFVFWLQYAFSALMRHREAMTEEEYNGYTDKIPKKSRNLFKVLSQSYENKDFHVAKRPPKDGVSFGMIPNTIVNRLLEKHNR